MLSHSIYKASHAGREYSEVARLRTHRSSVIVFVVSGVCLQLFSWTGTTAAGPGLSNPTIAVLANESRSILMNSPGQEKEERTPEQRKIDSQLLYAIYQMRGEAVAKGVPTEAIPLEKDAKGRVLVEIRSPVTKKLLARIEKLGGRIVNSSKDYDSIIAYLSLAKLETLARSKEVKFIAPKAQAMTN